ncbi:MAG: dihydropteroate synthase [Desulfobacterales bacterium]|nr:dihydropteroate synthase [Desulfobacterales bacterium]
MRRHEFCFCGRRLHLDKKTAIMGILNVTPDSFSDGGKFLRYEDALARAREMIQQGADIIDIGGESSRPFSEPVSTDEELNRVLPVIRALAGNIDEPISIDTTKAEVARRAVGAGAEIINDISAMRFDPDMAKAAADTGAGLVLMHMKGTPKSMQKNPVYDDLIGEIRAFLTDAVGRAKAAGVEASRIVIDPGVGFGKTVAHNLQILQQLNRFDDIGPPLLLGVSRKAFIRTILGQAKGAEPAPDDPDIETGTHAAVAIGIFNGAGIVRVHNVARARAAVRVADAICHCVVSPAGENNQ